MAINNENEFITIVWHNSYNNKLFSLGTIFKLVKDFSNTYDSEAIAVVMRHAGKIGYVANSTKTVVMEQ